MIYFQHLYNGELATSQTPSTKKSHQQKYLGPEEALEDVYKASNEATLKLEDLEKMKFDLGEEKLKIRKHENKLSKIQRILRQKELQIQEHKVHVQQRKDSKIALLLRKLKFFKN